MAFDWSSQDGRKRIAERAREIATGPGAGTDEVNWLRAERELWIAERAREIAATEHSGSDQDNWLRAERELWITIRAQKIARAGGAGSDYDNWLRAEWEVNQIMARVYGLLERSRNTQDWNEKYSIGKRFSQKPDGLISVRARELGIQNQTDGWLRAWIDLIVNDKTGGP